MPGPNYSLQPTSLPSVACFNLRQQVVGSAAAERGRWAAEKVCARLMALAAGVTLNLAAEAADFYVEDPGLVSVPGEVAAAVTASLREPITDFDDKPCTFVGKQITLRDDAELKDWVVTTAGACGWAASAAPVWLLRGDEDRRVVVLSFVTYDLTVGRRSQKGMHHVATARETAKRREEQLWKFDGKMYEMTKMTVKEDEEPGEDGK